MNFKLASACVLMVILAACSSIPQTELQTLRVTAQSGANVDTATALDIVFVFNESATSMLPRTGPEWFEKKPALMAGLGSALQVVPLQIPPSSTFVVNVTHQQRTAVAVYAYANYVSAAGMPGANLTRFKCVQVVLEPLTLAYRNCS